MLLRLFINFLVLSQSIECIVKGEFLPCLFLLKVFLLLVQYKCVCFRKMHLLIQQDAHSHLFHDVQYIPDGLPDGVP